MSKKIAIMQPYFFPYIGYFQLIRSVDEFVIYDNIEYTKKGWINRNRILMNGKDRLITLPIKKDSDFLNVVDRQISTDWNKERVKLLNQIKSSYNKATYFNEVFPILQNIIMNNKDNLFDFIFDSIISLNKYLDIKTKMVISSSLSIDHNLKSKYKVIEICKNLKADVYINSIGGVELYDKKEFQSNYIKLNFLKSKPIVYKQFNNDFIQWLSIIDVMMFNSKSKIDEYLNSYELT